MELPIISRFFQPRAGSQSNLWASAYNFFFGSTTSGKTVNEKTALQNTALYARVRILSLQLRTYRHTQNRKEKAKDHQIFNLLADAPNQEMTSFVFREIMMGHIILG